MNDCTKKRVAVLISGRGTNMAALIEAQKADDYPAKIVVVIANTDKAAGIKIAEENNIPALIIPSRNYKDRLAFDKTLHQTLQLYQPDLICLAGFMRILTPWFVEQWIGRILNIHPSLLPLFPGTHTHERVLEAGHKTHGCTVHFVIPELDAGPIIAQTEISVDAQDTATSLATKLLEEENRLYPKALAEVASNRIFFDYPKQANT